MPTPPPTDDSNLSPSQKWYRKLKSDPERYFAFVEKQEAYTAKHKQHLRAKKRKSDKLRYQKMMQDPYLHEKRLAYRRARHRARMESDPAYREKLRLRAKINNDNLRSKKQADPALAARLNKEASARAKARHDFLAATPEGQAYLKAIHARRWQHILSNPSLHEKAKAASRIATQKYRLSPLYQKKKLQAQKIKKRKAYFKAYYSRPDIREKRIANAKAFRLAHPDYLRKYHQKTILKCSKDPTFYAKLREQNRKACIKWNDKTRKHPYSPRINCRIPDYCTKGHVLDTSSPFLLNNLSNSQTLSCNAFAHDLAISNRNFLYDNNLK